jgi:class 3 adenylate cyclase/tetratricopeptide (TPR) repeat protein
MQCPKCRFDNPEDAKFCNECGGRLELACPSCQKVNPPGSKFCSECGGSLRSLKTTVDLDYPPLQSPVPKFLAERILAVRESLIGERKQVTVLFADIRGSLELIADRDPEEARALMESVLKLMMEAVHQFEGTVNQVMGDGIMALFGAPLAQEDHALRACYAALRMQDIIHRHSEELRRTQGLEVQIRVGLNSGEVVVDVIGSDLRAEYTAVGQTTHLAARMEQLAAPGTIRITADTFRLVEGRVQVKPLGPVPAKGLPQPVEVFELTGAGLTRSRFQATSSRGLSRFVGRSTEFELLTQALKSAAQGQGQLVAAVGEPGVGKSRLYYEFTHSPMTQGWLILSGYSVSYGKATTYLPLAELLKDYFGIRKGDGPRNIREKVTGKLLILDQGLKPAISPILNLFDVPAEDSQWDALLAPQRRQRTLEAVKHIFLRESLMQPLLVIFEDLHWIDGETQLFLNSFVDSLPGAKVLLLVNYRPEFRHGWGSKGYYHQIRLDPLPEEAASELLQALLGEGPALIPLKQMLAARTGGNPLFLEESVRMLMEKRMLIGEPGAYRLTKSLEEIQIPDTVQAILASRIDRLSPGEKHLLQCASVIGKDVPFTLLKEIAEQPDEELRRNLLSLQAAEFLYEASLFPDLEYTFKHALTHAAVYGSLLRKRRSAWHRAVVEAIERIHDDRLTEHVELLAHHALRGEAWEKAVRYSREAATKAYLHSAMHESASYFEEAIKAIDHLPETRSTVEQAIDMRLQLRQATFPLADHQRNLKYLEEAEDLACKIDDRLRLGTVSADLGHELWCMGDLNRALECTERAVSLGTGLGNRILHLRGSYTLAQVCQAMGDYKRAIDLTNKNIVFLDSERIQNPVGLVALGAVVNRTWLAWSLSEIGSFAEGLARSEEGIKIAETANNLYGLFHGYCGLGMVYLGQGHFDKAVIVAERGLHLCEMADLRVMETFSLAYLGLGHAREGRIAQGLEMMEKAVEQSKSLGMDFCRAIAEVHRAEVCLLAGLPSQAGDSALQAIDLCRIIKARGCEAWGLKIFADIECNIGERSFDEVESRYTQAITLADELGMRPLIAHCHRGLGVLYQRDEKRDRVQKQFSKAIDILRQCGADGWAEKYEKELTLIS